MCIHFRAVIVVAQRGSYVVSGITGPFGVQSVWEVQLRYS
jgi:hypothetical protein